jgi:restriction endonuclease S subunit
MSIHPTYKASGIDWLGDIPEHWEVKRIINVSTIANGSTPKSNVDKYWEGDITWVTPGDISKLNGYIFESERMITQSGYESCGTVMVSKNSTVITCRAPIGNTVIAGKELCTNQGCKSLIPLKIEYRYLYYFILNANEEIISLGQGTTFLELSRTSLGNTKISFPNSLTEQTAIANYLAEKTNKLDQLIKNKKAQIAQLKEIRQIEINTAVTKGLDPNTKLKASGIEWLGDIPEHWEVKRIKNLSFLSGEKVFDYSDGDFLVALENITSWTGKLIKSDNSFEEGGIQFNSNSVLFGKLRPYLAKAYRPEKSGICVSEILSINCESWLNRDFLFYRLLSDAFIDVINGSTFGAKMPRANWLFISSLKMPLPSVQEQTAIANYLDEKTSKLDHLVNNLENQIAQLQEVRKIEIFNAVTGKIKIV